MWEIHQLTWHIYNKCLISGLFPDRLKYARIIPLFKNGDRSSILNYRPISLLTSFAKIFEILIYCRLNQHMLINNVVVPEQFGFRKGLSINNATYKFLETICQAWNKKSHIASIFCDLT
jgi:hypothetical protein